MVARIRTFATGEEETPLIAALTQDDVDPLVVSALLDGGADASLSDQEGLTPLGSCRKARVAQGHGTVLAVEQCKVRLRVCPPGGLRETRRQQLLSPAIEATQERRETMTVFRCEICDKHWKEIHGTGGWILHGHPERRSICPEHPRPTDEDSILAEAAPDEPFKEFLVAFLKGERDADQRPDPPPDPTSASGVLAGTVCLFGAVRGSRTDPERSGGGLNGDDGAARFGTPDKPAA